MRLLTALVLLLGSSPVFAQIGKDLDSDNQVSGYGHIFGYACGAASVLVVLLVIYHTIKGMRAEHIRGTKTSEFREEILDKMPKKQQVLYLGEKVPDWKIDNRRKATKAVLKFLAHKDELFEINKIENLVDNVFRLVKEAIEARLTKKIERVVTADCLQEILSEIARLRKKGDLHKFGRLEILGIEIIHIEVPTNKMNHTFTALVSAKSKDYFVNDETGELLRGDKKIYLYQEFWCFRRSKQRWRVERIRPSGDMDRVLEPKNVLAQADLDKFAKKADPEYLREFVAK